MNPDDIFERSLAALYEAALDDARWPAAAALVEEAVGTGGSTLSVGEGFDDDVRLYFARFLQRVRWLIQQVYRKLGVSGQVALVRQVLAADALPRR